MNRNSRTTLIRILLLMAMMIVMMSLCGCRTRITNNDEVSGVMYDEDGYMMDNYQMRRDELSLSTAKKPLFTGLGAPADDDSADYNDDDAQMLEDYDPSIYEEDLNEPEEVSDGPSSGNGSSSQGSGGRVIRRNTGGGSSSSDSYIEVVLEPNGGTCSEESVKVKKGGKYGKLPDATREDHIFDGWYTKAEGGTRVGPNTKVGATKSHFLYAHWKASVKKVFTVTFDVNGEGAEITSGSSTVSVEEGGTYGTLPTVVRKGYIFEGWFPSTEGGSKISAEDKVTADHTVYAHWTEKAPYDKWSDDFQETAAAVKDDAAAKCHMYNEADNDKALSLISDCRLTSDDSCEYEIFFGTKDEAQSLKNSGELSGTVIVIPKKAVDGDNSKEVKLLYRLMLFDKVYKSYGDDVKKAASEMGVSETDYEEIEEI